MTTAGDVRVGIIGGGLMGRELAAVCGRWDLLVDHPARPRVVAVADPSPAAREWFDRVDTVTLATDDWRHLVEDDGIDVLYIAVPHQLHEEIYVAAPERSAPGPTPRPAPSVTFSMCAPASGTPLTTLARSRSIGSGVPRRAGSSG